MSRYCTGEITTGKVLHQLIVVMLGIVWQVFSFSQIWNLHLLLIYSPANKNRTENMYMYLWGANFLVWQRNMFIGIQLRLGAQCQLCTLTPLIFSWLMKLKLFPRPKMRSFPSSLLPASIFEAAGAGHDYQRVLVLKIVTSSGNFDGERIFFYGNPLLPLSKQNKVMCPNKYLSRL